VRAAGTLLDIRVSAFQCTPPASPATGQFVIAHRDLCPWLT
jgi:hypothetical protein